jgi:dUTP pyrophosphatase
VELIATLKDKNMKISQLPKEVRIKALKYQKEEEGWNKQTDYLEDAFYFYNTIEQNDYWMDWHNKEYKEESISKLKVKIKKLHPNSIVPSYAKEGDAGMDLTAVSEHIDKQGNVVYGTGLAFEIPKGYVGLLFPRSSLSNTDLRLTNSVGVIDSGYRGEVSFKFRNDNFAKLDSPMKAEFINGDLSFQNNYSKGERVGQILILPYPEVEFEVVEELTKTERGNDGYGSTGK